MRWLWVSKEEGGICVFQILCLVTVVGSNLQLFMTKHGTLLVWSAFRVHKARNWWKVNILVLSKMKTKSNSSTYHYQSWQVRWESLNIFRLNWGKWITFCVYLKCFSWSQSRLKKGFACFNVPQTHMQIGLWYRTTHLESKTILCF